MFLFLHNISPSISILTIEHGGNRKILDNYSTSLSAVQQKAVLGAHALTGNSSFRKGKNACWKMALKYDDLFPGLGNNRILGHMN